MQQMNQLIQQLSQKMHEMQQQTHNDDKRKQLLKKQVILLQGLNLKKEKSHKSSSNLQAHVSQSMYLGPGEQRRLFANEEGADEKGERFMKAGEGKPSDGQNMHLNIGLSSSKATRNAKIKPGSSFNSKSGQPAVSVTQLG